jgi:O-antigen/teichoic acid export membrane protein
MTILIEALSRKLERLKHSRMARNASWLILGRGIGYLLQAFYFVLLARLLGITEYGIYAGAFAYVAVVSSYSGMGAGSLFLRYVSMDGKQRAIYWGNLLMATAAGGIVIVTLLDWVAPHFLNPASAAIVLLTAIANSVCNELLLSIGQVFQAFEKMHITAILNFVMSLMRVVVVTGMTVTMHHANAQQWAWACLGISGVVAMGAIITVLVSVGWPTFRPGLFYRRIPEGMGFALAYSSNWVYNDIDKALLSHFRMNRANGLYTMAYRAVDVATVPISSVYHAAMPSLFRLGTGGIRPAFPLLIKLLKSTLVMSLVIVAVLYLSAPMIPILLGKDFAESVSALRWICFIPLLRCFQACGGSALTCSSLQRYRTAAQFTIALFNILLNLWMIPAKGWLGAAQASLISDALLALLLWSIVYWRMQVGRDHADTLEVHPS